MTDVERDFSLVVVYTTGATATFTIRSSTREEAVEKAKGYPNKSVYTIALYDGEERLFMRMVN